jgi:hypothetical protein
MRGSPVFAPLALVASLTVGCVSGHSSSDAGTSTATCIATFYGLCAQACTCGAATGCTFVSVFDAAGEGTPIFGVDAAVATTLSFDGLADCEKLYTLTCSTTGGVSSTFDYAGCASAASEAGCVTGASGTTGAGFPAACSLIQAP